MHRVIKYIYLYFGILLYAYSDKQNLEQNNRVRYDKCGTSWLIYLMLQDTIIKIICLNN